MEDSAKSSDRKSLLFSDMLFDRGTGECETLRGTVLFTITGSPFYLLRKQ
jgi:hypothetical protein